MIKYKSIVNSGLFGKDQRCWLEREGQYITLHIEEKDQTWKDTIRFCEVRKDD